MNLFRSTPLLPCKEERRWIGPQSWLSANAACAVCVLMFHWRIPVFFSEAFCELLASILMPFHVLCSRVGSPSYSQQCFSKFKLLESLSLSWSKFTSLSELGRWVKSCSHLYLEKFSPVRVKLILANGCLSCGRVGLFFDKRKAMRERERERVRIEWRESKLFEEPWLRRYWSTSFSFSAIQLLIFLSKISRSRCGYMHNLRDAHKRSLCYC